MALKMYGVSVCVVCSAPGLRGLGLPHMWPRNIEHCIVSCALFVNYYLHGNSYIYMDYECVCIEFDNLNCNSSFIAQGKC